MDAWGYSDQRGGFASFADKAERENPGFKYVRREKLLTGLWCDVTMVGRDGVQVTRRLFF